MLMLKIIVLLCCTLGTCGDTEVLQRWPVDMSKFQNRSRDEGQRFGNRMTRVNLVLMFSSLFLMPFFFHVSQLLLSLAVTLKNTNLVYVAPKLISSMTKFLFCAMMLTIPLITSHTINLDLGNSIKNKKVWLTMVAKDRGWQDNQVIMFSSQAPSLNSTSSHY